MRYTGSAAVKMPFGRHAGQPLGSIDVGYLTWLAARADLRQPLAGHVFAVLAARRLKDEAVERTLDDVADPEIAAEIVTAGLRALAKRHHPDAGGDAERMTRVNVTAAWLRERLVGARR